MPKKYPLTELEKRLGISPKKHIKEYFVNSLKILILNMLGKFSS